VTQERPLERRFAASGVSAAVRCSHAASRFFSPKAITLFDGIRSYKEVSAIPAQDAFPDRFLKIESSVCFGDSGGPLFHDGTVVAINTWTFSARCDGPNLEYRVDSAPAQAFLDTYL
jgi:hypothetical protein